MQLAKAGAAAHAVPSERVRAIKLRFAVAQDVQQMMTDIIEARSCHANAVRSNRLTQRGVNLSGNTLPQHSNNRDDVDFGRSSENHLVSISSQSVTDSSSTSSNSVSVISISSTSGIISEEMSTDRIAANLNRHSANFSSFAPVPDEPISSLYD